MLGQRENGIRYKGTLIEEETIFLDYPSPNLLICCEFYLPISDAGIHLISLFPIGS
jgi:hypothetical protein